jgi:alkylation response protein AidB-like acyl-CoA dehydrogenase
VSPPGRGVKYISNMLTITRLYNASSALSAMKRLIALARDYSTRRVIGKSLLSENPLHVSVLSDLEVTYRGNLVFYLKIAELFSKEQAKKITPK